MYKHLRALTLTSLVVLAFVAFAGLFSGTGARQVAINSTALNGAVTKDQTFIVVDSASAVTAGDLAMVDKEFMRVTAISGSRLTVRRGQEGSVAVAHADDAVAYIDSSEYFERRPAATYAGTCTRANEFAMPKIVIPTGRIFDCPNGEWVERVSDASRFTGSPTVEGRLFVREDFDQGYIVAENDATGLLIKSVTDTDDNVVIGSPLGLISYREEQTKTASSWVIADGVLDISADDTTDNEGVEIVFGGDGANTSEGVIVAGTSGACFSASITIADISGTDQVQIGWRQNETWQDAAAYAGYTVWNTVGVNATDGSIVSSQEVSEATDTDDSGVNWADGETRLLKVCISKAGVPTAFYSAASGTTYNAITMTETGSTLTAGLQLYPFISYLAAGTDGPDVTINWVQLEAVPR
jgi:hypothetical protein